MRQESQVVSLSRYHSQGEIAGMVGLSRTTVQTVQHKYHVTLVKPRFARPEEPWDRDTWGRVLEELYGRQRLPLREVGQRTGLGRRRLKNRLRALGFEIRTTTQANTGRPHPHVRRRVEHAQ